VLHIQGGVHVDPGCQKLEDILQRFLWRDPGALVWANSSTRMRAGLRARAASRSNSDKVLPRYSIRRRGSTSRPFRRASVFRTAVGLRYSHHHIKPFSDPLLGCFQHGIGFPHSRGRAKEDLQPSLALTRFLPLDVFQQQIWIWPSFFHGHDSLKKPLGSLRFY